jgi:hypothetical protein
VCGEKRGCCGWVSWGTLIECVDVGITVCCALLCVIIILFCRPPRFHEAYA